jgi:hypothetical protein
MCAFEVLVSLSVRLGEIEFFSLHATCFAFCTSIDFYILLYEAAILHQFPCLHRARQPIFIFVIPC